MSSSASFSGSPGPSIGAMGRRRHYADKERSMYDDDFFVSPLSDRTPSWSGTRWTRFFPELSSHFTLVSPVSTHNPNLSDSFTSGAPSITSHMHQSLTDFEETAEVTTGSSSLWSDELVDDVSSYYSRRSSVTSINSELSSSAYKSADAFSIISPIKAGVFNDIEFVRQGHSSMMNRQLSVAESKEKPLPCEPPIQMAPLSIRRKKKQPPPTIREGAFDEILESITRKQSDDHPTLSQAAEELENALADLVEHKNSLPHTDAPLQVCRGNMDMIATRAAPIPPINPLKSRKVANASSDEDMKHAKKPHKGRRSPFSFTMPGFGKKHNRPHLRSLSGSSVVSELERKRALQNAIAAAASKESARGNGTVRSSGLLSPPLPPQRPVSVSSERELRLKIPRLQTKNMQSSGKTQGKPPHIASADKPSEDIIPPSRSKPGEMHSESEGKVLVTSSSTEKAEPIGPHCNMDPDSGPIVIHELEASFPPQQIKTPITTAPVFVPLGQMPRILPNEIVGSILQQCGSLQDLFNFAVMNKQFYRVFKKHELELIKSTVFAMSPPAWELRQMSPPWDSEWQVLFDLDAPVPEYTPSLYLDRYTRDLYTLVKLKALILARCGTFLRPETVCGLAGMDDTRATEIDNAFWRVWTFCRIFGCGKSREGDIIGQMDWLNGGVMATSRHTTVATSITDPFGMNNVLFEPPEGFGLGNQGVLTQSQLYDMTEIWTCLGVLLQPIHGKCSEARKAGIYDGHDVAVKDSVKEERVLEEWTFYILTLGPSAVLALGSIATVDNAAEIFQRAQSMGLTKWEPADASRAFFFREAVSKAYKPQPSSLFRRSPPHSQTDSNSSRFSGSSNPYSTNSISDDKHHRRRQAAYATQLRNRRNQPQNQVDNAYVEERPISNYAEIMNRLAGAPAHPQYRAPLPPSIPPPPPQRQQATAPTTRNIQVPYSPARPPAVVPMQPRIRDPTDQAIDMMVRELGFQEEDAKWALKITDTGEGINPNAAVSLLIREYQNQSPQQPGYSTQPQKNSILSSVIHSQASLNSGWRWA